MNNEELAAVLFAVGEIRAWEIYEIHDKKAPKKWIEKDYKGALSSRGRSRMFQNLRNCPAVDAKTMGCFAMAQTIMMADKTNPSVQINVIHLPAFRSPWTKDVKMAAFMPRRIENLSVCVDRYCSAIYRGLLSVLCAAMGISVFLQMRIYVEVWSQGIDHVRQQVCTTSTQLYNLVVTYYLLLTQYFPWVL